MVETVKRKRVKFDLAKAVDWLDKHWGNDWTCSVCGNSDWMGEEQPMELRAFNEGRLAANGPVIPLLTITCSTCGNTLFFNAILAGLVEKPE